MLEPFEKLGTRVARTWEASGKTEESFGSVATECLADSRVLTEVEPEDIVSWLMNSEQIPEQHAEDFGQPPVNVYMGDGFYIQALFWNDSTTAIHEHSFAGAFGVMHGSSVHSNYRFTVHRAASPRLVVGETTFLASELLHRGEVRTILAGDRLIHSLYHLVRPSVSIVVRTLPKITLARPQFAYLKPHLAFDDRNLPKVQITRLRMLESLATSDLRLFWATAGDTVGRCDPFILCQVLAMAYQRSDEVDSWQKLLGRVPAEHAGLIEFILPCLREGSRANRLISLRSSVHDPVHRFLLALLLNVPSKAEIYRLIAQKFPGSEPKVLVVKWLGEIFGEEKAGIRFTPDVLFLVDCLLEDPDFERSKAVLQRRFEASPEIDEMMLRNSWAQIMNLDFLKSLFSPEHVM